MNHAKLIGVEFSVCPDSESKNVRKELEGFRSPWGFDLVFMPVDSGHPRSKIC